MSYYSQGVFKPKHPEKYKGSQPIVYRSSPELKMMSWFDIKGNIVEWTSESVIIPYIKPTDGTVHRYYMDFSCIFKNPDGTLKEYMIEYKPFKQTQHPLKTIRKSERTYIIEQMTYAINKAKWQAAEDYAKHKGMKFLIVTERDLKDFTM